MFGPTVRVCPEFDGSSVPPPRTKLLQSLAWFVAVAWCLRFYPCLLWACFQWQQPEWACINISDYVTLLSKPSVVSCPTYSKQAHIVISTPCMVWPFLLHLLSQSSTTDLHVPQTACLGMFHLLFLLPGVLSPGIYMANSFTSLRSWLRCNHHFSWATLAKILALALATMAQLVGCRLPYWKMASSVSDQGTCQGCWLDSR